MPIYDYKCKNCNKEQQHLVKLNEEPPECIECKQKELEKQISRETTHVLKGKGWYKDGY